MAVYTPKKQHDCTIAKEQLNALSKSWAGFRSDFDDCGDVLKAANKNSGLLHILNTLIDIEE